ncbi:MAG: efflux RND transporter periplasmic adaptor subunit [Rhodobacteraceae bacterium]|nr:efflux RND transporter periplasmic adaptor subunit [Paracoccaceae bacterium]
MKDDATPPDGDIRAELGLDQKRTGFRLPSRRVLTWGGVAVVIVAVAISLMPKGGGTAVAYRTVDVTQGGLTVTVSATGTLEPVNTVEVGAEISGQIEQVLADYNDPVTEGQILAKLDPDNLVARVELSRANLSAAKARVQDARATATEARTKYERIQDLAKRGNASKQDLDSAKAADARAQAGFASAEAQVEVAQANLTVDETNLSKAEIRSPINGVVLLRQVEPGQTVAASFQTPVLFKLAESLMAMQLVVDIDEADIGSVKEGQTAEFSVAAFPDRKFPATITQVRYEPKTVEGVVSYQALLNVDNSDLTLRPGMTATASIVTVTVDDTLLVPAAALRFQPPRTATANGENSGQAKPPGLLGIFGGGPNMRSGRPSVRTATRAGERQPVWVLDGDKPVSVMVTIGPSDGTLTSVTEGDLKPGQPVIVGVQTPAR